MDIVNGIRAFNAVVESGGFAAAARQLGLSRSVVSKQVIQLETALGARLFTRSTRWVAPTDAGRAFYDRAVAIVENLDDAMAAVTELHEHPRGTLRVNAPMSFGTLYLSSVVARFMQSFPDVRVELVLNDRAVDPIEEGFDVTIRVGEAFDATSLIVKRLGAAPRVLCASPGYLKEYGEISSPTDLKHHRCLHYGYQDTGSQWRLGNDEATASYAIQCVMWSNNGEVLRDAAIADQGVALLPLFIVANAIETGQLQTVLPGYLPQQIDITAIYPRHRLLSAKLKAFVAHVESALGKSLD